MKLTMRLFAMMISLFICFYGLSGCMKCSDSEKKESSSKSSGQTVPKKNDIEELKNIYISLMKQLESDSYRNLEKLSASKRLVTEKLNELTLLRDRISDPKAKELHGKFVDLLNKYNDAATRYYDSMTEYNRKMEELNRKEEEIKREKQAAAQAAPGTPKPNWGSFSNTLNITEEKSRLVHERDKTSSPDSVRSCEMNIYFFKKELGINK